MAASVGNRRFPALLDPPSSKPRPSESESDSDSDSDSDEPEWKALLRAQAQHLLEVEPAVHDPRDEGTADAWVPRNPTLIRLTGKHPFNCEPPLARLMHHGFITPAPLHYVRNHGPVPRADWSTWTVELPVTLVCAGNRRKEQNMVRQTVGFNWAPAPSPRRCGAARASSTSSAAAASSAASTARSTSASKAPRSCREAEGPSTAPACAARWPWTRPGTSCWPTCRTASCSPRPRLPVRVIIPGFIGGRMVKWLKRIIVSTEQSESYYHYRDNRVLPSHVDAELANEEAWWYKPEYIINELNINSVITTPGHDEILPINALTTQRPYIMRGYAYSGGGRKVTRVEVTLDGGESWHVCSLDRPEKPNKYGKYWCWCFWSVEVEVLDLLGAKEIAVRAWDESLNTQPEKLIWNVMGMMNNCWFKVRVNVCKPHRGEIGLVFEHPTQPGNLAGGWMARQKHMESSEGAQPALKKSTSTPFMNTVTKQFSMSEVRRHSTPDSAWIVVHDHVYDCTAFLKDHPGGADSILINAGTDCTEEFDSIHSDKAKKLLDTYRIGELVTTGYTSDASVHGASNFSHLATIREATATRASAVALSNPREKVQCTLVSKAVVSHDVRLFRFALPFPDQSFGLPVGKHIFLSANIDGKPCMRAYTPTSPIDEIGHFDLLVKIYFKGVNPKFPNGGLMTQHLESLPLGSKIDIKGPLGHIEYTGRGNFLINGKQRFARRLAMIAGGSGITPVYQDDILLRDELDRWAREHPDRLKVWYVVGEVLRPEAGWPYSVGFVTEQVLREHVPPGGDDETLALVCGPPPMIQFAVRPNLEKMKYDLENSCLIF
uniref:Nitrate reductase n=1 Tax=Ananas comosus var. bracteatus TaxID=296719 RepID=A0A6V7P8N9_ANACO|nr:unnamed protein product [Ananas comosus var. bracteatus]